MPYRLTLLPAAVRALKSIPDGPRKNISQRIDTLSNDPRPAWGKMLNVPERYWVFRVADYRTIYRIDDVNKTVIVVEVGNRSKIYRGR